MISRVQEKLKFLKTKKEEYVAQVVALNGAIQCLEELLDGEIEVMDKDLQTMASEVK